MKEDLKSRLEKLADFLSESISDIDNVMPNIGDCSLTIEHQKYKLAQIFENKNYDKEHFLAIVNFARLFERNLYAATGKILIDKKEISSVVEELYDSLSSMSTALKKLYKKILDNKKE